jgi:hypothetical protein
MPNERYAGSVFPILLFLFHLFDFIFFSAVAAG